MRTSLFVLVALGGVAHADPAPARPPAPAWQLTVGGLVRSTSRDADADAKLGAIEEYGYTTKAAALTGLRGDLSYGQAPIVDLGIAWAWGRGTFARGPLYDDPDELTGSTLELGAFARVHWVRRDAPVAAEPRVELGVARASVDLRGASRRRVGVYTRIGLDLRAGGKKAGAVLSIDYTSQHRGEDLDLDVPTGGVTFALSFYWRT